ncbi:MAG: CvpA family protein [Clostridia bacterium]|nr:CvpA family protein [Clostridia bacterium]
MPIIVDIVILAILALCVTLGYRKGLTKCLINVLAFLIAIVVAGMLFKPASAIVRANTEVDENIQSSIVSVFEQEEQEKKDDNEKSSPIMEYLTEQAKGATEEKKKEIVNNAAKDLSVKIVDVLSFIGIFIIVRILLIFVKALADLITKLPIIKQCDKIGGIVYGILQALVIIFIALALITFISTAISKYELLNLVNQSYIGSILNNNNILLKLIF